MLVHVCNDVGGWGRGFVLALSRRWASPERDHRAWSKTSKGTFELGMDQFVAVEPDLWVANVIGQRGIRHSESGPPVRYDAIRTGLRTVGDFAQDRGTSVRMPRIGAGLAGGDWPTIERIIESEMEGISVTVYDLS